MKAWKQRAFKPRAFVGIVAIMVCGFVFIGCSDGNEDTVAVTGVTLVGDATFSLSAGQNKILSYTVQPSNATNKNVSWSSSNTGVAIASEGIVYAIGEGTATITVTTQDGRRTTTCTVYVTGNIAVTGVELDKPVLFLDLEERKSGLLSHTVHPANASNKKINWLSSNQGVATVSNGTVTAVAAGTATITVTTEDGGFKEACAVTVVTDIPSVDGMVWIYPGTFIMGSPIDEPESFDNEMPHKVTLTEGFYMSIYPVQQEQYLDLLGWDDSYFPDPYFDDYLDRWREFPTDSKNWYEAIRFCNLLSVEDGLSPAYTMYKSTAPNASSYNPDSWADKPENWSTNPEHWGLLPYHSGDNPTRWNRVRVVADSDGYRLPTEAQWEYACRAGTTTPFNTGNNITTDQANYFGVFPYNGNEPGVALWQTVPAGMYAPNAWGLYDMHGNVSEWCWDWYGSYVRGTMTDIDPKGSDTGTFRVTRGGSYYDDATYVRSACREGYTPLYYSDMIGFRVVRPYSASRESRSMAVGLTRSETAKMTQEGKIIPQSTRNFNKTSAPSPVRLQGVRRKFGE
jgi:formylglycine-generating enzyme required for sulfatase activity